MDLGAKAMKRYSILPNLKKLAGWGLTPLGCLVIKLRETIQLYETYSYYIKYFNLIRIICAQIRGVEKSLKKQYTKNLYMIVQ